MTNAARQNNELPFASNSPSLISAIMADMAAPAPQAAPALPKSTDPAVRDLFAMVDVPGSNYAGPPTSAVAVAPAPVAKPVSAPVVDTPKPRKRKLTATWGRLPGDIWGVRCQGGREGDTVTVVTKAGKKSTVTLGREVKPGLFEKVGRQSKAKPRKLCPGNNNCRRYGWRRGPRCR